MSPAHDEILSVGIDVGTTTTHLVFSRLKLANSSLVNQTPKLSISAREIIHRGDIHETPVTADGIIDAPAVGALIAGEYQRAGMQSADVQTGAVIITGESARLRNAENVVAQLANYAGDFVVASAGPRLESILAARGSGAALASRARGISICNVDIGGGTTNLAIYASGICLDTACLSLGGRTVRVDNSGRFDRGTAIGERFRDETPERAAEQISETIVSYMQGQKDNDSAWLADFIVCDFAGAGAGNGRGKNHIDEFWICGGVGKLIGEPEPDVNLFGDLGPRLARELAREMSGRGIRYSIPADAMRATVIGAGLHSVQLSGSTVCAAQECLPLRDVPLVRLAETDNSLETTLAQQDLCWSQTPIALLLEGLRDSDYDTLCRWADYLAAQFIQLNGREPLVAVAGPDVGMALGQLLRTRLVGSKVVIIDGINQIDGDFIDIGKPLRANALPVVIKELIFG